MPLVSLPWFLCFRFKFSKNEIFINVKQIVETFLDSFSKILLTFHSKNSNADGFKSRVDDDETYYTH